jgi:hypothetical protein
MKRVAWAYWAFVLLVGVFVVAAQAGVPLSSDVQKTAGPITGTIPVVTNFTVSTVATIVIGAGSVNLGYAITNEDGTNAIRCEYGTTTNTAPVTTPTTTVGRAILPGATFVELIAPNNRLDCVAVAGSPHISLTVYPK